MKHSANKSEKEIIIQKIASFLSRSYSDITTAYLFGSFVRSGYFADIDIGIITKTKPTKPLKLEIELEIRLEDIVKFPVDARILNNAPISFCQRVIRFRKVILDRNPGLRADFEGRILKQYFDFCPFRMRYLEEVINAPI